MLKIMKVLLSMLRVKARISVMKFVQRICVLLLLSLLNAMPASAQEATQKHVDDTLEVMEVFNQKAIEEAKSFELTDDEKHQILFVMGVLLLVLLCATAYLGINMVVFNKDVFVSHMISAGLTVTLGLAHAVAAIVWFFPY